MFNLKLFFSLAVFTILLIITSLIKNHSRIMEKKINLGHQDIFLKIKLNKYICLKSIKIKFLSHLKKRLK